MKAAELAKICLEKKIPVSGNVLVDLQNYGVQENALGYVIEGFSKSGTVTLFDNPEGEMTVKARYDDYTDVYDFDDIVNIAWSWFISYKDREPFTNPDHRWLPHFIAAGKIKEVVVPVTKYEIQ